MYEPLAVAYFRPCLADRTHAALTGWYTANVDAARTAAKWANTSWAAQGAWLGGSGLDSAVFNSSSSYCSWPFLECDAACATSHALTAM